MQAKAFVAMVLIFQKMCSFLKYHDLDQIIEICSFHENIYIKFNASTPNSFENPLKSVISLKYVHFVHFLKVSHFP